MEREEETKRQKGKFPFNTLPEYTSLWLDETNLTDSKFSYWITVHFIGSAQFVGR